MFSCFLIPLHKQTFPNKIRFIYSYFSYSTTTVVAILLERENECWKFQQFFTWSVFNVYISIMFLLGSEHWKSPSMEGEKLRLNTGNTLAILGPCQPDTHWHWCKKHIMDPIFRFNTPSLCHRLRIIRSHGVPCI